MKKVVFYSVYFIIAFCIFVIATVPARFVINQVDLPKDIQLNGVSGSIWQANVQQLVHKDVVLNQVTSSLSFWSLLTLSPTVDVSFGDTLKPGPLGKLTAIYRNDTLTVENAEVNFAANDLIKNAKLLFPIEAKGSLDVRLAKVTLGKPICAELVGDVHWPKARIKANNQNVTLGDIKAKLGCEEGALSLTIDDKNDLGLAITAYMRKPGKFKGEGTIQPGDKFPKELTPILGFLGKPNKEGQYRLKL